MFMRGLEWHAGADRDEDGERDHTGSAADESGENRSGLLREKEILFEVELARAVVVVVCLCIILSLSHVVFETDVIWIFVRASIFF